MTPVKAEYEIRTVLPGERETDVLIFGRGAKALLLLPGLSVNSVLCSAAAIARAYGAFTATHTVYLPDRRKRIAAELRTLGRTIEERKNEEESL